jgi:beta-glucosidase
MAIEVSLGQVSEQAAALLGQMTLAEKIGQMTQVEKNSIDPRGVKESDIGSVLSGGGGNPQPNNPENWRRMVRGFQEAALETRLAIPLIYGVDAVHGHNNVIGATIFPHNIGLGAARDEELVAEIGRITATEVAATGVPWTFAPAVSVPQDLRWGRTFEGYSQNTELVSRLGPALVRGLQNAGGAGGLRHPQSVLASVKHFAGDGGTQWGTGTKAEWIESAIWEVDGQPFIIDQGETVGDEAALRAIHLTPYVAAIAAGALNIMVSFSSWGGLKMHAHRYLLTEVLKGELNFAGFLISDWMGISQLSPDYYECVVTSINAGLDMIMVPYEYRLFIDTLTTAVEAGDVPLARINDAVRRILRVKIELGLFEHPFAAEDTLDLVGSAAHRAVAREAVAKSAVLLKNDAQTLPLDKNIPHLLLAGQGAHDIGLQCGGWTIEWMGELGAITPGTTILEGIQEIVGADTIITYEPEGKFERQVKADAAIVVLSETPYAEGVGDRADLALPPEDLALLARVRPLCRRLVVILLSGRPLIVTSQIHEWDAFVAAWLPGTEGQGLSDVLFGDRPFQGKLPCPWPRSMAQIPLSALAKSAEGPLFDFGFGLEIR